jgi:hypothetical protein
MHPGERQFHLSLHAADPHDTKARGLARGVPQQRRLSDTRVATDDQNATLTLVQICEQLIDEVALAGAAQQVHTRQDPAQKAGSQPTNVVREARHLSRR